jgi:hypothetical protein
VAYYDTEELARNIGQLQANAMSNMWEIPTGRMLEPGSGMGGGSDMLELGPFGQSFAGPMLEQDWTGNPDSSGQTAMNDLFDLRSSVEREANRYDAMRMANVQRAFARGDQAQMAKTRSTPQQDPAGFGTVENQRAGGGVYAGAFPHAEMIKGYIPEDLREDPELMRIIAAGAHAESGWDVNRIQNGFKLGSGQGARGLFQFDMGGMGAPYKGREHELLGEAGARLQASKIVPLYADWYRKRAQSGLTDPAAIASWVAAQAERPYQYDNPNSAARQHYASSYKQLGQSPQAPAASGSGAPYQVNRTSQFGLGLSREEALAFCGPAAAIALTSFYGNNIPVEKVREAAIKVGWTQGRGMAGPQSQVNLLKNLGVNAQMSGWNEGQAQKLLGSGTPLIIDTPGHYFVADQYDPNRGYRVGTSGTDLRQGAEWMTPQQMAALAVSGAPRAMIWRQ